MMHLTKLEKQMLLRAIEFALAGAWPWEEDGERLEQAALKSARDKLESGERTET